MALNPIDLLMQIERKVEGALEGGVVNCSWKVQEFTGKQIKTLFSKDKIF